ncbi:MAG: hypothetical protein RL701_5708 [Pseudomonadota bacterium]
MRSYGPLVWLLSFSCFAASCDERLNPNAITVATATATATGTGGLAMRLQLIPGINWSRLDYQIVRGGNSVVDSGQLQTSLNSLVVSGFVGALAPADNYVLLVSADATVQGTGARAACSGIASFAVAIGQTTTVEISISCPGITMQSVAGQNCPRRLPIRALPSEAPLGAKIALRAEVDGPDASVTQPVAWRWSTTLGSITEPAAVATALRCTEPGTAEVHFEALYENGCNPSITTLTVVCRSAGEKLGTGGRGATGSPAAAGVSGSSAKPPSASPSQAM